MFLILRQAQHVWLEADTEDGAWANLLEDAAHMPYKTKEHFIKRGYTVEEWEDE